MVCKNCGTKIKSGETRCSKCQKKVERSTKKLVTIILFAVAAVLLCAILVWYFAGSSNKKSSDNTATTESTLHYTKVESEMTNYDSNYMQFKAPSKDEEIAVLHTNMGDIYMRLFEDVAPKSVENFKTHIKEGYYDGIIFHRVMENFMIQGGDPTGTGTGGESIWGGNFEDEFNSEYHQFRGALCMANTSYPNTNSSQFYIIQAGPVSDDEIDYYEQNYGFNFNDDVKSAYKKVGGTPWLEPSSQYNGHTVFGQVFCGMNVVDEIAQVKIANTQANKPIYDVVIESAEILKYNPADFE